MAAASSDNPKEGMVFCVRRDVLDQAMNFKGFRRIPASEVESLLHGNTQWVERCPDLEEEGGAAFAKYVQIIPYTIFLRPKIDSSQPELADVWTYVRSREGNEARLHARQSIGVGGHIEPSDILGQSMKTNLQIIMAAQQREVVEEIEFEPVPIGAPPYPELSGLVHLDATPVDRAHVGVVFINKHLRPITGKPGSGVQARGWMDTGAALLSRVHFEGWSIVVMETLFQRGAGQLF